MRKILGLRTYINLTLIVILVGGIVFTAGFGICLYMARGEVTNLTNNGLERDLEYLHTYMDNQLQRVEDISYSLSRAQSKDFATYDTEDFSSEEHMFKTLENFLDIHSNACGIAIGLEPSFAPYAQGPYGFAVYVTNVTGKNERLRLGTINDFKHKEWYQKAAELDKPYWSLPFRETNMGKVVTCFSLPLHDSEGNLIGILAIDIDTEAFRLKCNDIMPFNNTEVTLVDREFRFISHPDTTMLLQSVTQANKEGWTEENKQQMQDAGNGHFVIDNGKSKTLFYYDSIKRTGWTIGIECPMEEVYGNVDRMKRNTTYIALISILFMIICFIYLFRRLQKVTMSKAGMENELKIAADIQMGMIPKTYPAFPDCTQLDVYGLLKPAKSVGGDLYDYFIRDGKLFFCIGDVSGKGVPASLFMSVVRALFRNVSLHDDDPAVIISSINSALSQGNDQNIFCTIFLGILDINTGELEFCNAGHDAPVIADREGNVQFLPVDSNIAVGVIEDFKYKKGHTSLNPDEYIFLYTDGVTEAENTSKELFGLEATRSLVGRLLAGHKESPVKEIIDDVYHSLRQYTTGAEQNDDITMVIVKYRK